MPAHYGKFVAYFRVSTDRQGKSGLGLEAQRETVLNYLDGGRWTLIAEFTEIESGKRNDRPELEKALAACKKQRAKLVIAKLDRLSRNLAFIATLMDSGVEFIAVDNPHANKLTVHILAAVAQHEREIISVSARDEHCWDEILAEFRASRSPSSADGFPARSRATQTLSLRQ
jgi:DNA invertase Pin-like site-specific DNA recombinase